MKYMNLVTRDQWFQMVELTFLTLRSLRSLVASENYIQSELVQIPIEIKTYFSYFPELLKFNFPTFLKY